MERETVGSQTRPVETPVEARQGFLDRPVLVVLIVSLALVIIAFGILWLPTVI
jgi:cobalamin biosynthesis Mg chelatase CobN